LIFADLNPVKVRVKTVNAFQPAGIVYGHVSGGALGESITPRMLVSSRHSRGFTGMSAPSSEADVAASAANFRYGPTPDMISLLDHLSGAVQHRWRDFEAKRFGGLEIDHQLECGRLLNWYIAWLCTPQNLDNLPSDLPIDFSNT
jgi:hypothetical protein